MAARAMGLSTGATMTRGITCELTGRAAMAHELEVDVELRAQWGHPLML